ncbi:hypothetical protein A2V68_01345 [candidate division Kazan bacterium RBG_13_50_9]|uniref:Nucleotidyl transferase domain-containing protein n=1 Tax=candidate division Kazan bacterium RBG_13_50_9 TaxID=1798535 RepID=A0A1F4NSF9_UNCK3|nr:MAG: hypothetical protein A2V68_01345 [candidate division Kazan bacterium RBG_13_50_9]
MDDLYAVIFAGGVGSRLWPVSRVDSPKQVQPFLDSEDTLIQRTWKRVRRLLPPENIYLSTMAEYARVLKSQLPELLADRLIVEPELKSTCPAVGLATAVIAKRHPGALMMNVWADHYYAKEDEYLNVMRRAAQLAKEAPDQIMTVGFTVEYPTSAYGYLEVEPNSQDETGAFRVKRFVEKPDPIRAAQFMAAGNYYWNPALWVWPAEHMLKLYEQYVPDIYQGLMEIQAAWDTPIASEALRRIYPSFTKVAIEYAILERGPKMKLLPASLGWRDIGSWQAVYDVLSNNGESAVATKGRAITIDSEDVLVFNEDGGKLVAAVGLQDIAIVNTKDALLVIKKSRDQDVKKLVEKLESEKMTQHL